MDELSARKLRRDTPENTLTTEELLDLRARKDEIEVTPLLEEKDETGDLEEIVIET